MMRPRSICAAVALVLATTAFADTNPDALVFDRNAPIANRKAAVDAMVYAEDPHFAGIAARILRDHAAPAELRIYVLRAMSVQDLDDDDEIAAVAEILSNTSESSELRFEAAQRLMGVATGHALPRSAFTGSAEIIGGGTYPVWLKAKAYEVASNASDVSDPQLLLGYVRPDTPPQLLAVIVKAFTADPEDGEPSAIPDPQALTIVRAAFHDDRSFRYFDADALKILARRPICRSVMVEVARSTQRSGEQRLFALEALENATSDPQVVSLVAAVSAEPPKGAPVSTAALMLYAQTKNAPSDVVKQVYSAMNSGDAATANRAIEALPKIAPNKEAAVQTLVKFVRDNRHQKLCSVKSSPDDNDFAPDDEDNPCKTSLNSIRKLKAAPDDAVPLLKELLGDEALWAEAAQALAAYGKPYVGEAKADLMKQLREHRGSSATLSAIRQLGSDGIEAIPPLVHLILIERRWGSRASYMMSAIDAIRNDAINNRSSVSSNDLKAIDASIALLRKRRISDSALDKQAEALLGKLTATSGALHDAQKLRVMGWLAYPAVKIGLGVLLWIGVALFICSVLLRLRPLWLLAIHMFVKRYATVKIFNVEIPIGDVLFVTFFGLRDHVLDAWIAKHADAARERFSAKETVKTRLDYVELPVDLEGHRYDGGLPFEKLRRLFARKTCLVIRAEGGAGKTSLAVKIAMNVVSEEAAARFTTHCALPILIEEELPAPDKEGKSRFIETVAGRLADLVGDGTPIPADLVDRLLRRGRILVIVDHFSEMSEQTRNQIMPAGADFPIRLLVITSRVKENLGGAVLATLRPLRIEWSSVARFLQEYLSKLDKLSAIPQDQFHEHCARLVRIAGMGEVTVLMAKLYAELVAAAGALPATIPDLVLDYLNHLNSTRAVDDPSDLDLQAAVMVVAYCALDKSLTPKPISRGEAVAVVGSNGERIIAYLERLGILQGVGAGRLVRFVLDPIAEYLAALNMVDRFGSDSGAWQTLLDRRELASDGIDRIRGFLTAIAEAIAARPEIAVPESVLTAIQPRLQQLRLVA